MTNYSYKLINEKFPENRVFENLLGIVQNIRFKRNAKTRMIHYPNTKVSYESKTFWDIYT
ncbi:hypothetical protein [Lutibacter sp.]